MRPCATTPFTNNKILGFDFCYFYDGGERMRGFRILSGIAMSLLIASPSLAAETVTYTYDAKGRLTKVVRTGTVNNNVTVEYEHDKADNRTRVKTTNSPNPPP